MANIKEAYFRNNKDTYVFVSVDTCNINQTNKNSMVTFFDNRGDKPGEGINFLSIVNSGKRIFWIGIVKDVENNYQNNVDIKQIVLNVTGDSQILKKNYYYDRGNNGVVVGNVRKTSEYPQVKEEYNITILVNGTDYYTIDPQLEMIM